MPESEKMTFVVEWMINNPDKLKGLKADINSLTKDWNEARKTIEGMTPKGKQQEEMFQALDNVVANSIGNVLRQNSSYRTLEDTIEEAGAAKKVEQKELEKSSKSMQDHGKSISKLGREMGLYGFIATFSMQRIILSLQQMATTFQTMIQSTADWQQSIMDVAMAQAYMDATGQSTVETSKLFNDTIEDLAANGLKIQANWMALNAEWRSVEQTLSMALLPALNQVADQAAVVLNTPEMQKNLQGLAEAFGQVAIAIIPAVPAIVDVITQLAGLLKVLAPYTGILVPLVAYTMILGTVLTFLGPLFNFVGKMVEIVGWAYKKWTLRTQETAFAQNQLGMAMMKNVLIMTTVMTSIGLLFAIIQNSMKGFTESYDDMTGSIQTSSTEITDANGNILYTIDNFSGEVKDATGTVIGSYDSMTGYIKDAKGEIIGYVDPVTKAFYGLAGSMAGEGGVAKALGNLQGAVDKMDFSGLQSSMNDSAKATNNMNMMLGIMSAINIASIITQLGGLAKVWGTISVWMDKLAGLLVSTPVLGTLLTSNLGTMATSMLGPAAAPIIAGQMSGQNVLAPAQNAAVASSQMPWYYNIPFMGNLFPDPAYEEFKKTHKLIMGPDGIQQWVPKLASGGITTGPTLAMIGEGTEQEAVLPLSKLKQLLGYNVNNNINQEVITLLNQLQQTTEVYNNPNNIITNSITVFVDEFTSNTSKFLDELTGNIGDNINMVNKSSTRSNSLSFISSINGNIIPPKEIPRIESHNTMESGKEVIIYQDFNIHLTFTGDISSDVDPNKFAEEVINIIAEKQRKMGSGT